jgi:hypothetical protein
MSADDDDPLRRELEKAAVKGSADVLAAQQAEALMQRLAAQVTPPLRAIYAERQLTIHPTDDGDPVVIRFSPPEGFLLSRENRRRWLVRVMVDDDRILRDADEPKADLGVRIAQLIARLLEPTEEFSGPSLT